MSAATPTLPTQSKHRRLSPAQRESLAFYAFLSPWLIGFVGLTLGPIIASFAFSFSDYDAIHPLKLIGLQNYVTIAHTALFWQALKVTALYTAGAVPLGVVGALLLATLLNQRVPALSLWRTLYYLPVVTSGVAVALLWSWIFQPDFGVVNTLLYNLFHIQGPQWFFSPTWALPAFIVMSIWGVGGPMLIYLAGMQGVPTQLYEAADLDGAGRFQKYFRITLPMISPVIFFNLIMLMIGSFQVFTGAFVITQGGPSYATYFYVLYLYQEAFQYFHFGYASALAWILFVIVMALTILAFRFSSSLVYYDSKEEGR
jgi:multiple sugar transport system permease protein